MGIDGFHLGAICARPKLELCLGQVGQRWFLWEERPAPKFGASGFTPTFQNNLAIPIKNHDGCVCKEHSATGINKRSQSNE